MYINKAILYGNLTRDPEMKALPSGAQVTNFSIATNRTYKDKNGTKQESTDYHNIVTFGRQAEIVNQYMKKGSGILVEGRLTTRSWDGADGKKNYRTEIIADSIQFGPKGGTTSEGGYSNNTAAAPKASAPKEEGPATIDYPEEDINPEDIPF